MHQLTTEDQRPERLSGAGAALAHRPPVILCVDDDPGISTAIEMHLRPFDVCIERAFYGMQGIWETVHTQPDLVIMDLAMPNGDGSYALDCLKRNSETAAIPIIILTGMRDPALKMELKQAGADVYLHKPVSFDELRHHISRFVDLRLRDEVTEDGSATH